MEAMMTMKRSVNPRTMIGIPKGQVAVAINTKTRMSGTAVLLMTAMIRSVNPRTMFGIPKGQVAVAINTTTRKSGTPVLLMRMIILTAEAIDSSDIRHPGIRHPIGSMTASMMDIAKATMMTGLSIRPTTWTMSQFKYHFRHIPRVCLIHLIRRVCLSRRRFSLIHLQL